MTTRISISVTVFFLFAHTLCGQTARSAGNDSLVASPDSVLMQVEKNGFSFDSTFTFRGTLNYNDGNRQLSFAYSVRMLKDSITWLSLNVGGLEVGRGRFTRDSASILLPMNSERMSGDYSLLRSYIQYPLDFNTLNNLLLGNIVNNKPTSGAVTENDSVYTIYLEGTESYQQATVMKKDYKLQSQLLMHKLTMRDMKVTFDRMIMVGNSLLSHYRTYELSGVDLKAFISMKVTRTDINKPLTFPF